MIRARIAGWLRRVADRIDPLPTETCLVLGLAGQAISRGLSGPFDAQIGFLHSGSCIGNLIDPPKDAP